MAYFKLTLAALAPVFLSIVFYYLKHKTNFKNLSTSAQQIIYGISFGILSIAGTEMGISYLGAQLNCRDAAVLTAGLMFGGPAGIIAGIIGATERWFSVYWGIGYFTRVACTISTLIAGIYSAVLRRYMFDNRRPEWLIALAVGVVMEVFHLTMVFVTNMATPYEAAEVVKVCSMPMISANGISVMLSGLALSLLHGSFSLKIDQKENTHISQIIQRWLIVAVALAFVLTSYFVIKLQSTIAVEQVKAVMEYTGNEAYTSVNSIMNTTKSIAIYANIYTEILVFAVMFASIYILLKIVVVNQLHNFNDKLEKIADGDLNVSMDIKSNKEYSSLSKDINSTVDTLKHYIKEASERIDRELEVAREIQISSLPAATFDQTQKKGFDLFADMHTAKEVGGDLYDYFMPNDHTVDFTIADISGKGIPAAMFMMRAKIELNNQCTQKETLAEAFIAANNALCVGNDAEMFITACHSRVDLNTGVLTFVNAGHNPPVIRHADGRTEFFKTKPGLVLAAMENFPYKEVSLQLEKGDIFFVYTDGVTEGTNFSNEQFGDERLLRVIHDFKGSDMTLLCRKIKEEVENFAGGAPQFDDITMIAFCYGEEGSKTKKFENATIGTIEQITAYVEQELEKTDCSPSLAIKFNIAIDEIVSNIIKYGYKGTPGPIWVEVFSTDTEIGLIISDAAEKFNPLLHEDPDITASLEEREIGGLGLFMVKKSMDKVEYRHENGKNVLTISKLTSVSPVK